MAKYIYFIFFNLIGTSLIAQISYQKNSFSNGLDAADYSFNIGSEVGTSFKNSYYISNYFSPSATFDITKKFSVVLGVGVKHTQLNNIPIYTSDFNYEPINANLSSVFTYASGIYSLSPKLNLSATVMFEEVMLNAQESPMALNKDYKDVSLGLNYNVTRHFSINTQINFSDRPYNNFFNGISNSGMNSSFHNSPFF